MIRGFVIESGFSEDQVEACVAQLLGWAAAALPIHLISVNEQLTGADKMCDVGVPLYLQFKKSTGLRQAGPIAELAAHSGLLPGRWTRNRIRLFRREHGLGDDPTLCFELRKQARTATELQHNILLRHHLPPHQFAVYVAPLFLDYDAYIEALFRSPRFAEPPFFWESSQLTTSEGEHPAVRLLGRLPFLRGHIAIPPHDRVTHHRHHYAFSASGQDVSFHSEPIRIDNRAELLSQLLMSQLLRFVERLEEVPELRLSVDRAGELAAEVGASKWLEGETPVERLQSYGRWLRRTHGISQLLMVANREKLWRILQS